MNTYLHLCLSLVSIQQADIDILKYINQGRVVALDSFFVGVTNSASPVAYSIPIILLVFSLWKRSLKNTKKSIYILISVIVSGVIGTILKHYFDRPRPFITYPFLHNVIRAGSPSFPSGHTLDAFAFATAFSLSYRKWYYVMPAYVWAIAVGYSRMDLGVHYPSDVLGGVIVGCTSAVLCCFIGIRLQKKYSKRFPVGM